MVRKVYSYRKATGRRRYIVNGVIQKTGGNKETDTQASPLTCSELAERYQAISPLYRYLVLFIVIFSGRLRRLYQDGFVRGEIFVQHSGSWPHNVNANMGSSCNNYSGCMIIDYYGQRATMPIVGSMIPIW